MLIRFPLFLSVSYTHLDVYKRQLDYVARKSARNDVPLIMSNNKVLVHALSEEIIKNAYMTEGKPDAFNPDNVRFLTDNQFGYATGVTGIMRREKVATNIAIGAFWAESLIFAQTGYEIGAVQIAGTANTPVSYTHLLSASPTACTGTRTGTGNAGACASAAWRCESSVMAPAALGA